jgi:hypothetical protein
LAWLTEDPLEAPDIQRPRHRMYAASRTEYDIPQENLVQAGEKFVSV